MENNRNTGSTQERIIKLRIITAPLPSEIHGASGTGDGQRFTVLINEADDPERQAQAFLHEMLHIWNRDHGKTGADLPELEQATHAELNRLSCR